MRRRLAAAGVDSVWSGRAHRTGARRARRAVPLRGQAPRGRGQRGRRPRRRTPRSWSPARRRSWTGARVPCWSSRSTCPASCTPWRPSATAGSATSWAASTPSCRRRRTSSRSALTFVPAHPEPVVAQVLAQLDALGVGFGACHTEFVVHEGRARIIEVNYRAIGDQCDLLLARLLGVPLFEHILRTHLGEPLPADLGARRRRGRASGVPVRRPRRNALDAPAATELTVDGVQLTYRPLREQSASGTTCTAPTATTSASCAPPAPTSRRWTASRRSSSPPSAGRSSRDGATGRAGHERGDDRAGHGHTDRRSDRGGADRRPGRRRGADHQSDADPAPAAPTPPPPTDPQEAELLTRVLGALLREDVVGLRTRSTLVHRPDGAGCGCVTAEGDALLLPVVEDGFRRVRRAAAAAACGSRATASAGADLVRERARRAAARSPSPRTGAGSTRSPRSAGRRWRRCGCTPATREETAGLLGRPVRRRPGRAGPA